MDIKWTTAPLPYFDCILISVKLAATLRGQSSVDWGIFSNLIGLCRLVLKLGRLGVELCVADPKAWLPGP